MGASTPFAAEPSVLDRSGARISRRLWAAAGHALVGISLHLPGMEIPFMWEARVPPLVGSSVTVLSARLIRQQGGIFGSTASLPPIVCWLQWRPYQGSSR